MMMKLIEKLRSRLYKKYYTVIILRLKTTLLFGQMIDCQFTIWSFEAILQFRIKKIYNSKYFIILLIYLYILLKPTKNEEWLK